MDSDSTASRERYQVGKRVKIFASIVDDHDGEAPSEVCADVGEIVIIRSINWDLKTYPISVSHEHITDRSFGVALNEIELVDEPEKPNG